MSDTHALHRHLITQFYMGQMLFQTPNQQCQSIEGYITTEIN